MLHFLYLFYDLLLLGLLMAVSVRDLRTMTIPDRLNLAIFLLGLLRRGSLLAGVGVAALGAEGLSACGGLLAAALPMYLLAAAFPGSIGGGDIKFAAAAGVYLGWEGVLRGAGGGMLLAGCYAAFVLLSHKKTARQAFALGPFLAAGFFYVCVSGM